MSDLNDPRVFFAAERTLMAWTRTAVALMAFGFAIERSGVFWQMLLLTQGAGDPRRNDSFWIGISLVLCGAFVALISVIQYRGVLKTLKPVEIPHGYSVNLGVYTNLFLTAIAIVVVINMVVTLD